MSKPRTNRSVGGDHRGVQRAVHGLIDSRDRAQAMAGKHDTQTFDVALTGLGYVDVDVHFDTAFIRQPGTHVGGGLVDGDILTGRFEYGAAVTNWVRSATGLYVGAHIRFQVTHGHRRQRSIISITFAGICLTLPLGHGPANLTLDDPI